METNAPKKYIECKLPSAFIFKGTFVTPLRDFKERGSCNLYPVARPADLLTFFSMLHTTTRFVKCGGGVGLPGSKYICQTFVVFHG